MTPKYPVLNMHNVKTNQKAHVYSHKQMDMDTSKCRRAEDLGVVSCNSSVVLSVSLLYIDR